MKIASLMDFPRARRTNTIIRFKMAASAKFQDLSGSEEEMNLLNISSQKVQEGMSNDGIFDSESDDEEIVRV